MKKLILSAATVAACIFTADAQTRTVLHEEFTGENCGPCAGTNPTFWALCGTNTSKMVHIVYMADIPAYTPHNFYLETQTIENARGTYYQTPFAPYGRFDGTVPSPTCGTPAGSSAGHPGCLMQSDIDAEAALTSPINIECVHYFNAAKDSVFGHVTIKAVSAVGATQLKLRAAFTRSLTFATSPGTNGEKTYENIVRAMFPDAGGQPVSAMAAGQVKVYTFKGKISGIETGVTNFTQVDSNVVVWVQNDSAGSTTKIRDYQTVLQAAQSTYRAGALGLVTTGSSAINGMSIYPNPTSGVTAVSFDLQQAGNVEIKVIDQLGRTLNTISTDLNAGTQSVKVPTTGLAAGIYIIQAQVGNDITTQKLEVVK